jgi:inner membrane protein involved in colicin E2 resistance
MKNKYKTRFLTFIFVGISLVIFWFMLLSWFAGIKPIDFIYQIINKI